MNNMFCTLPSPYYIFIMYTVFIQRMRWAGHVAHMGKERGVYRVLVGKPEGKRPLGDVGMWTGLDRPRIETGGGHL